MAFLKTSQLLMRKLFKTEIIFSDILKESIPISKAVDKYIQTIRNKKFDVNRRNALEFLEFPYQTFNKLNQNSLKNIITETYNILKEQGLTKHPNVILKLLQSYSSRRINVDIDHVLKILADNKIAFDKQIYSWLIIHYSYRGEMKKIEILLNEMKSKGIQCSEKARYFIVSGYIIAGQPEKAESFIKEHDLSMESHDMFYYKCYGYASIADVDSLKNVLAEMKEKNIKMPTKRYFNLYEQLVSGNVEKSDLIEIIDLTKIHYVSDPSKLYAMINNLNFNDHFNYSFVILEKFVNSTNNHFGFIELFGKQKCPVNTFKQVVELLGPKCRLITFERCIFDEIDFETAFEISKELSEFPNWKVIYYSILNKAINERSLDHIDKVLHLIYMNLGWLEINLLIQQAFLPLMLKVGMVSNYEEVLALFPKFKKCMLPLVQVKYLCAGDFTRYNELISTYEVNQSNIIFNIGYLSNEIRNNLSLKEVKKWSVEARKCIDSRTINNVLINTFNDEVKKISNNQSSSNIEEIIDYAQEWNIELSQINIDFLKKIAPEYFELILSSIVAKNEHSFVIGDSS